MLSFLISKKWWVLLAIVALAGVGFWVRSGDTAELDTATVQRGSVVSEVSVTGTVKPAQSIDLGFEVGGRIASIFVDVGNAVGRGQTLAVLDNSELQAQLAQAEANLADLKSGARPEEIRVKELALVAAQNTLEDYYENAINAVEDAYIQADDAVRTKTDALFSGDEGVNPQLTYTSTNSQAEIEAEASRRSLQSVLDQWSERVQELEASSSDEVIEAELRLSRQHLSLVLSLLSSLQDTLNNPPGLDQATVDAYRTDISTARTNVLAAASGVDSVRQSIESQRIAIAKAESDLALVRASEKQEVIDAQLAQIDYYQSQIAKTIITAPFGGTITRVTRDPGEIVTANTEVVSLIGSGIYTIEVNITESDIAKVSVGDTAVVTLDAYSDEEAFEARVVEIDIGATEIEGVPIYKTTLQFTDRDSRIRPGLTADVDILNDKKEDVLYVSTRNIIARDGKRFVKVPTEEDSMEVEVKTGLRGSDGRIEITQGLNEGDIIVTE